MAIEIIVTCDGCNADMPANIVACSSEELALRFNNKPISFEVYAGSVFKQNNKRFVITDTKQLDFCSYNCFDTWLEKVSK